jgi:acetylornithine deacetylase
MPDHSELTALVADLVHINSVNPDLAPGGMAEAGMAEAGMAAYIAEWATRAGLEASVQEVEPGRPNVIIVARGTGGGQNLMLNGHTDTVGLAGMTDPLSGRVEGSRLYGRGAYDMKAGLAACLMAARRARALHLRGDVIVAAVVDEELASKGTQAVIGELDRWKPEAVIVAEPTEMTLAVAHKGFMLCDVETFGVAAHGSRPHLGVDAIVKMGHVLVGLEKLDLDLRAGPAHPYLGSGSVHASLIEGGQEPSTYPAYCKLQLERRTIPGETPEQAEAQLQAVLDRCAAGDGAFKARLTRGLTRLPFEADEHASFVRLCREKLAQVTGRPATAGGVSFWADSGLFGAAGLPAVLLGPQGFGAHGDVEWIDLDSVRQCADVYTGVAQEFCR